MNEAPAPSLPRRPWALYLGLGLSTGSLLLLQVFLTRVFSVLYHSSFAFLAISLTFLGLGSAGIIAYLAGARRDITRNPAGLAKSGILFALLMVAGFVALVAIDQAIMRRFAGTWPPLLWQLLRVVTASLCMLPAAFAAGMLISLTLRRYVSRVNRLYCCDLLGAGAGCLLALPLMNYVGGDQGIFVIAAMAAAGAALLGIGTGAPRLGTLALIIAVLLAFGPLVNRNHAIVGIRSYAAQTMDTSAVENDVELYAGWNSLSRISVHPLRSEDHLYVRIDSSCQTSIPRVPPDLTEAAEKTPDLTSLPLVLDRHRSYLEIGAGGGPGMLSAVANGAERAVGIEINPIITRLTLEGLDGYGIAALVNRPGVELVTDEGRSYVAGTDELFETITITFIQTGVADASAGFALTEASLFTVEAFADYLEHLEPNGLFYVYRHGGTEMLRLISVVREALAQLGITNPSQHVYIASETLNYALLMVSLAPFTDEDIAALDRACDERHLRILHTPGSRLETRKPNPFFEDLRRIREENGLDLKLVTDIYMREIRDQETLPLEHLYLRAQDPAAFAAEYPIDISATTDDRPYFFFSALNRPGEWLRYFDRDGIPLLGSIVMLLFWMMVAFLILIGLLIFLPLALRRGEARQRRGRVLLLLYFAGLGLTYVAVEISFIQRFVIFLGHPAYATSIVLLGFLVSSGIGSLLSDWLFRGRWWGFTTTILAIVGLLALYNEVLPRMFHSDLLGLPLPVRTLLSLALILPLALLMGTLFPRGIRIVERSHVDLVPWAWGANSATSVLGTILALIFAIHFGFAFVAWATVVVYLALCLPTVLLARHRIGT